MNILKKFEEQIQTLVDTNQLHQHEITWLEGVMKPPVLQHTETNNQHLKLMLSAMFHYRFPTLDPELFLAWIPKQGYRIGIKLISQAQ